MPLSSNADASVCAVVVTFNRRELLAECVDSLLSQTRPLDAILVIDNASSDGTGVFLEELSRKGTPVTVKRLPENIGGAGGFYEGMRTAFAGGHDWLWLMDDDGRADRGCLEQLLKHTEGYDVVGPLIYCSETRSHAPFQCGKIETDDLAILKKAGVLYPVHPFNGVLIPRRVVEEIGYPEKKLFLWGDEQDYRLRWLKAGFREASFSSALYFHPANRLKLKSYAFGLKTPGIAPDRKYLFYRNQAWIDRKHRRGPMSALSILRWLVSILLFEAQKRPSLKGLFDGLRGDLNHALF